MKLKLLYIEDNPDDAEIIQEYATDLVEFEPIQFAQRLENGIEMANYEKFDLVFLDLSLPDSLGIKTLEKFRKAHSDIPVIVFTGSRDQDTAIEAINMGAQDYLVKEEICTSVLRKSTAYAIERFKNEKTLVDLKNNLDMAEKLANMGSFEFFTSSKKPILSEGLIRILELSESDHIESIDQLFPFFMKEGIERFKLALAVRNDISDYSNLEFFVISETSKLKRVGIQLEFRMDETNQLQSVFGTMRDITESYQNSQRLKESEEKLLEAQALANIGSWEYYFYGNKIIGSPEAYRIFEIDDDSIQDPSAIIDLVDWSSDAVKIYNTVKRNLNSREPFSLELQMKTPRGNQKNIRITAQVHKENQFKGHVMRGTVQDITIITEAEDYKRQFTKYLELEVQERTAELEKVKAQLEDSLAKEIELSELKSRFVSTASHQFRTPLTVIQSSIGLLEMQTDGFPDNLKHLVNKTSSRVNTQIDRMTSLMNDILILGKIEARSVEVQIEETDVVDILNRICNEFNSIQKDNREIFIRIIGDKEDVFTDALLLEHIMMNLISNAFKYSQGSKAPELIVEFGDQDLILTVQDYGIGISEEDLMGLFEPFFRGGNAVGIAGTGLGTTIIKEYTNLLGGAIEVTSELNKGSLFTLKLPKNGKNINS